MGSERRFKTRVTKALKRHGAWVYNTWDTVRRGIPDTMAVWNGRPMALELKATGQKIKKSASIRLGHEVTAPQSKTLRDMHAAGALAGVLVGHLDDDACFFVPASDLTPGPTHRFDVADFGTLDDFLAWYETYETDMST